MNCFIYGLQDPITFEIRYIGQTSVGMRRPKVHFSKSSLKNKTHRSSWIKSLNGKIPNIIILEICDKDQLNEREIYWIAHGKANGWSLTNHDNGGSGISGYKHSEETKAKIGLASKKMWKTNPVKMTEEAKYKCGNSKRGKLRSTENKRELAIKMGAVPFNVYNKITNEFLGTFYSFSECARVIGEFRKTISWAVTKNKNVSKRFIFEKVI